MSNCLDPDQAQHLVGPNLGPNCLQKLSADDTEKSPPAKKKLKQSAFSKTFQEHFQSVKLFGSRPGPTFRSKLFAKVISRRKKLPTCKERVKIISLHTFHSNIVSHHSDWYRPLVRLMVRLLLRFHTQPCSRDSFGSTGRNAPIVQDAYSG